MPSGGDYMPQNDAEFLIWFANFVSKIAGYASVLGIGTSTLTELANDLAAAYYSINVVEIFKTEAKEKTQYKDTLLDGPIGLPSTAFPVNPTLPTVPTNVVAPGIKKRTRDTIARLKRHANYTPAIGDDLGVTGTPSPALPTAAPLPTLSVLPGSVVTLKFKKGSADAVLIEGKRGSETGFTLLEKRLNSPYSDGRAPLVSGVSELRTYRIRYVSGDIPVGLYSAEAAIWTLP